MTKYPYKSCSCRPCFKACKYNMFIEMYLTDKNKPAYRPLSEEDRPSVNCALDDLPEDDEYTIALAKLIDSLDI